MAQPFLGFPVPQEQHFRSIGTVAEWGKEEETYSIEKIPPFQTEPSYPIFLIITETIYINNTTLNLLISTDSEGYNSAKDGAVTSLDTF